MWIRADGFTFLQDYVNPTVGRFNKMTRSPSSKIRLDQLMVENGLCETRSQAQRLVLAGQVRVNGQRADKPGTLLPASAEITVQAGLKYVSRGGLKLEKALTDSGLSPEGRVALDVGASTGGFTDCLLQHGAAHVHAVDVGYGQLDWKLRQDARVSVWERTHIRNLQPAQLAPAPSVCVIDVSFISLKKVLPAAINCLDFEKDAPPPAWLLALVKPQFEYLDYCAIKGFQGVVTDPDDHETILNGLAEDLQTSALPTPWQLVYLSESPIQGPKGNREFWFGFRRLHPDEGALSIPFQPEVLQAQIRTLAHNPGNNP